MTLYPVLVNSVFLLLIKSACQYMLFILGGGRGRGGGRGGGGRGGGRGGRGGGFGRGRGGGGRGGGRGKIICLVLI